jgi:hypothetical protein
MDRHQRPYWCTFDNCCNRFGAKTEWRNHETTKHVSFEGYRCSLPLQQYTECARLFSNLEEYNNHLMENHGQSNTEFMRTYAEANKLGQSYQFWCGFCKKIIRLTKAGLEGRNDRFDHIHFMHFRNGETIRDWLPPSEHIEENQRRNSEAQVGASSLPSSRKETF